MPSSLPDYYAILELKPAATAAEIKQRYRELARRYHPDVNPSPDAAQRIKSVNEAHRVLGDPDRRSLYDAERILNPQPNAPKKESGQTRTAASERANAANPFGRQAGAASASPPKSAPARPHPAGPRVEFNGFGRVTPESSRPNRTEAASAKPAPPKKPAPDVAGANRLVSEAEVAFLTRNYSDAERLCREALAKDRATAGAHEVMGDIYAIRGDTDSAIKAYSYAIQFNPRSYSAQGKFNRLVVRSPFASAGPVISRKSTVPSLKLPRSRVSREAVMAIISIGLFAGGCVAIAEFAQNPGLPIGGAIPWVTSLSPSLMIALSIVGVVGGMLLAFYGKLWPISDELGADGRVGTKVPLLVILALFSLVWFFASLFVYIGVAVGRNRLSASTVRVYSLVLALVALFTIMAAVSDHSGWLETAAFAGNILSPTVLLGWFLGDCVRLRT